MSELAKKPPQSSTGKDRHFELLLDSDEAAAMPTIHPKTLHHRARVAQIHDIHNLGDSAPLISRNELIPNAHDPQTKMFSQEAYVDAQRVAEHLSLTRREVLKLTRAGTLPAHAIDPNATRKTYRYKLSEVDKALSEPLITEQALGLSNPADDNNYRQPRDQRG